MPREHQKARNADLASCPDTLEFRSPTTTQEEHRPSPTRWPKIWASTFPHNAAQMFAANPTVLFLERKLLAGWTARKYEVNGKKFRVSVLETTSPATVLNRKDAPLMAAMPGVATEDGADQVLLFVVRHLKRRKRTMLIPNEFTKSVSRKKALAHGYGDSVVLPASDEAAKSNFPEHQSLV